MFWASTQGEHVPDAGRSEADDPSGAAGWPEGRYCERLQLQFGGIPPSIAASIVYQRQASPC